MARAVSCPPSLMTSHSHAGGVERDRLVGAEHQQPVAERLQLDGDLAELRAGRELQPDRPVPGEHPDQRRVAGDDGEPCRRSSLAGRSSQSVTVSPDQRVSTVIVPRR